MKIAWFSGDLLTPEWVEGHTFREVLSLDAIMRLNASDPRTPLLRVLLVPDDADLFALRGDDWNDAPADCNAGTPYVSSLPDGAQWITLRFGDEWPRL